MSRDGMEKASSGEVVEIFTDGACRGNPGPGGWGALLRYRGRERCLSGGEGSTTNNRMELMAAIRALETLKRRCRVRLYTDSQYVRNGITRWLADWKRRGWKTTERKPVKNADLWTRLDAAASGHRVEWIWVRGHSGHEENERVDALARAAIGSASSREAPSPGPDPGNAARRTPRAGHGTGNT